MLLEIAKWVVIFFGLFIMLIGCIMLVKPKLARATLRKAGSTKVINYTEITIRLIPATALILHADYAKYPEVFKIFGWIMLITSFILYMVPRKLHHMFATKSADILKPLYFQLISVFAFLFGALIIYNAL